MNNNITKALERIREIMFQYGISAHKLNKEQHIWSFTGVIDMEQLDKQIVQEIKQAMDSVIPEKDYVGNTTIFKDGGGAWSYDKKLTKGFNLCRDKIKSNIKKYLYEK